MDQLLAVKDNLPDFFLVLISQINKPRVYSSAFLSVHHFTVQLTVKSKFQFYLQITIVLSGS